jgi:hypothetical protein
MNKKCIFIIFVACILVLGACFSAWKGDEGTISISIGGSEALGRARDAAGAAGGDSATDAEEGFSWPDEASHTITFSGGSGPNQERSHIRGGKTVSFSVAPGQWTITVKCFLEDEDGVNSDDSYAEGSRTVNIKPGPNGVIVIPMSLKVINTDDYIDGSSSGSGDDKAGTLRWAIEVVQQTTKDIAIIIDLPEDNNEITLKGTLPPIEGKSVTIRAKKDVTIKRAIPNFTASFFTIGKDGTLTLSGPIIIDGASASATEPLITIDGGMFIMNKDVTLQNNTNNSSKGGGVSVDGNGTFTMNDGTISGNTASYGGGVAVVNGTFTMKSGTIKGNTAADTGATPSIGGFGGGVYVDNNGKFTKTGGTIYGKAASATENDNTTVIANTGGNTFTDNGNAVYVTAVYDTDANAEPIRSEKKRNSTADNTVNLNSETTDEWN